MACRLVAALALVVTGCGAPSFAAGDLSPPGLRHVAVALPPRAVDAVKPSDPAFCARMCAAALRPGERVATCRWLDIEPILGNEIGRFGVRAYACAVQ